MNSNKRLNQLVTLKQLNLNMIADLLNTPNVDTKKLENARDTQHYLNYQISLVKAEIGTVPHISFPINSPIFQQENETSSFSSFHPTKNNIVQSINTEDWKFNAEQLLPKDNSLQSFHELPSIPERNKEEIIFKPSQEQLSGIVRLPEDNWVQTLPKIFKVQEKIEPSQEQLSIAPIKCETDGLTKDTTIHSSKFIRIPETTSEIEQAVKRDLEYLQQKLETKEQVVPVTEIAESNEDIYTDPYSEYYN